MENCLDFVAGERARTVLCEKGKYCGTSTVVYGEEEREERRRKETRSTKGFTKGLEGVTA